MVLACMLLMLQISYRPHLVFSRRLSFSDWLEALGESERCATKRASIDAQTSQPIPQDRPSREGFSFSQIICLLPGNCTDAMLWRQDCRCTRYLQRGHFEAKCFGSGCNFRCSMCPWGWSRRSNIASGLFLFGCDLWVLPCFFTPWLLPFACRGCFTNWHLPPLPGPLAFCFLVAPFPPPYRSSRPLPLFIGGLIRNSLRSAHREKNSCRDPAMHVQWRFLATWKNHNECERRHILACRSALGPCVWLSRWATSHGCISTTYYLAVDFRQRTFHPLDTGYFGLGLWLSVAIRAWGWICFIFGLSFLLTTATSTCNFLSSTLCEN